ncbi:hypothetical protein EVC62_02095 [Salinicola endophyticus]|uniref:Phage tail protein n=1 Tax=Salinicola endophyticus TaxID=1949083 RepID=A0ABY8FC86_9GAMM|nr:pyocin knob domain-containing protein [Salinicola endophyticus]WFF40385.1 hypothetical protein EVC62_02095 [Salinicola endophyticus]
MANDGTVDQQQLQSTINELWQTVSQILAKILAAADVTDSRQLGELAIYQTLEAAINAGQLGNAANVRSGLGLGSAATKNVGIGSGQLMQVGAFGIGGQNLLTDSENLNNITTPGLYACPANATASTSGLNYPTGLAGTLYVNAAGAYIASQLYITYTSKPEVYFRTRFSSELLWGRWNRLYHDDNIVGSVASGAVIESGSSSNGSYVKYADGTQECWSEVDLSYDSSLGNGQLVKEWVFPAVFNGRPTMLGGSPAYTTASNVSVNPQDIGPVNFYFYGSSSYVGVRVFKNTYTAQSFSSSDTYRVRAQAKGRWR